MEGIIHMYRSKNPVINDAFDQIAFQVSRQKEQFGHKAFYLCGSKPSVGSTMVAVELAIVLSVFGWKTLLLDCNLRKPAYCKHISDGVPLGLDDYLSGRADFHQIVYKTNWSLLSCITSGMPTGNIPHQLLFSRRMRMALEQASQEYDFILIDGPSCWTSVDTDLLAVLSNAVILVTAMDGSSVKALDNARKRLESSGANIIGVIENKVRKDEYRRYMKAYDYFSGRRFLKQSRGQPQRQI